ncbi:MAG: ABC transporter permease [Dehalococcoidales bacterium]|jgi:peptide/nickel transport system permease protein
MAKLTTETKKQSKPVELVKRMIMEQPMGTVGAIITLILLFTGIFARWLAPYGMNDPHPLSALQGPTLTYWLGTDNIGRDLLSRLIYGARISMIVGLIASLLSVVISVILGILSAYIGGALDLIIQRFVDAVLSIPSLLLLMVVISLIGTGMWQVIFCLGISNGIGGSRMIRSLVIGIKSNLYVQAAVSVGAPTWKILVQHILPNIMAPIIIIFSMTVPSVILAEAGLSFLGFGIPPPAPSWGGMLSGSARTYKFKDPWMALWPGLALAIVVYGVNMFGDALRDLLDPRLRGGAGRYGTILKRRISKTITKENPTE